MASLVCHGHLCVLVGRTIQEPIGSQCTTAPFAKPMHLLALQVNELLPYIDLEHFGGVVRRSHAVSCCETIEAAHAHTKRVASRL